MKSGKTTHFSPEKVREALYRPFAKLPLYFDPRMMTDRASVFPSIFPTSKTEIENQVICVAGIGDRKGFGCLAANRISSLDLAFEKIRCFPFYTYDEDGTNRRENITDWALAAFQTYYSDDSITKWDIFYYNYGILHHPDYREKYQEDLKLSLPRFHFANDFWRFAEAGKRLADIHINYESVEKYTGLTLEETPNMPLNWCVKKMAFQEDKTQIQYNDFLTIGGIPAEVHDYKLGDKSALGWIVDQYSITEDYDEAKDRGSRIVNDPNSKEEPQYILNLIKRVITVSLETVKIIKSLPALYPVDER